jgi:hypothetical protein
MHARRYFVKALDAGDRRAALPLAAYKRLYKIEHEFRDLDDDAKLAARRARSKPVWDELATWCRLRKQHEPPASKLGVALRYFTNHEVALARFLDYGFLPLDNGIVERLHVRTALTRKNFIFAGSDAGGERAAIAYTILGSCRLAGVDPREYLADVLPRLTGRIRLVDLPSLLPSLLPSRWAAQRAASAGAADTGERRGHHRHCRGAALSPPRLPRVGPTLKRGAGFRRPSVGRSPTRRSARRRSPIQETVLHTVCQLRSPREALGYTDKTARFRSPRATATNTRA